MDNIYIYIYIYIYKWEQWRTLKMKNNIYTNYWSNTEQYGNKKNGILKETLRLD